MKGFTNKSLDIRELEEGILSGDRIILAKAITLVESQLPSDQQMAEELIEKLLPKTGSAIRLGITGVPGVGKSTFIESFGKHLTSLNKKIAVLAVDPSSQKTKGSILGDKTRMDELSRDPLAFIRPSSTGGALGGVTTKTHEVILLCEAAGFEVILIETVGVGQSETTVREMTDFFLLLMLAGAGDELQGMKKGIMEMADAIIITKADGDNAKHALRAQADYQHALHLFGVSESGWTPKVLNVSALTHQGIGEVWVMIENYITLTKENRFFHEQRMQQNVCSLHKILDELIKNHITKASNNLFSSLEEKVKLKLISPRLASRLIFEKALRLKK